MRNDVFDGSGVGDLFFGLSWARFSKWDRRKETGFYSVRNTSGKSASE